MFNEQLKGFRVAGFKNFRIEGFKGLVLLTVLTLYPLNFLTLKPVLAQTPFYQGKTVRILVGFSPGGAFDVWARVIAHYMAKYVPGSPTFVVQNMTGGGSMVAANYVYSVANDLGRPLFGPPGIPADRVKVLREAFVKMMNDPELVAEAKKKGLDVNPTPGDELEALVKEVGVPPAEVIQRMKKLLEQ